MLHTSLIMPFPFDRQLKKQSIAQLLMVPVDKHQSQALRLAALTVAHW